MPHSYLLRCSVYKIRWQKCRTCGSVSLMRKQVRKRKRDRLTIRWYDLYVYVYIRLSVLYIYRNDITFVTHNIHCEPYTMQKKHMSNSNTIWTKVFTWMGAFHDSCFGLNECCFVSLPWMLGFSSFKESSKTNNFLFFCRWNLKSIQMKSTVNFSGGQSYIWIC